MAIIILPRPLMLTRLEYIPLTDGQQICEQVILQLKEGMMHSIKGGISL